MVVWVDAAAEERIIRTRSFDRNRPKPWTPKIEPPRIDSTSVSFLVLPRPMPCVPRPA